MSPEFWWYVIVGWCALSIPTAFFLGRWITGPRGRK